MRQISPPPVATSPSNHGKIALPRHQGTVPTRRVPLTSTLEYRPMTYGNGERDDTQQLRDIQDLIAKLEDVNKRLALPVRTISMATATDADPADATT
jgi:hypothetical protein